MVDELTIIVSSLASLVISSLFTYILQGHFEQTRIRVKTKEQIGEKISGLIGNLSEKLFLTHSDFDKNQKEIVKITHMVNQYTLQAKSLVYLNFKDEKQIEKFDQINRKMINEEIEFSGHESSVDEYSKMSLNLSKFNTELISLVRESQIYP